MTEHAGWFYVTRKELAEALGLPIDAVITSVVDGARERFRVYVNHPDLPDVAADGMPVQVVPLYEGDEWSGRHFTGWGTPEAKEARKP